MTSLQNKELDLLVTFIDICNKLNLRYYLVCGSALGAVKYHGFIPWDDDIDVALPRKDYDIFLNEAKKYLPDHIFLQNSQTDPMFPQIYSKLRDCRTAYIEKTAAKLPICHGIFIDIFPLDGYPESKVRSCFLELRKRIMNAKLLSFLDIDRSPWKCVQSFLLRKISRRSNRVVSAYTKMVSKYDCDQSSLICNHGNWQGKLEYAPREHYGEGIDSEFEGIVVRIPEQTDAYLRQKYGDYKKDLPVSEQRGHHNYTVCDCNRSYLEYMEEGF